MDKLSFTMVPRRKDPATGAFVENSGPLWAGAEGRLGLRVERVENLYELVKAPCQLVLYEVDGKGQRWSGKTELARFDVQIRREGTKFYFAVHGRKDTPTYRNDLPAPASTWEHWYQEAWKAPPVKTKKETEQETKQEKKGRVFHGPWTHRSLALAGAWRPDWQPAHLVVDFNTGGNRFERESCVVIPAGCRQEGVRRRGPGGVATDYFFSVGFEVRVGDELKYRSLALPVDCHNLLAHNLGAAARGMALVHRQVISSPALTPPTLSFPHRTGTHFGSKWLETTYQGAQQAKFAYEHAREKQLQFTSCMQYLLDVGELGFAKTFGAPAPKAGARPSSPIWRALRHGLPSAGAEFTEIARQLVKGGWISVYFNPDVVRPRWARDASGWRHHLQKARLALREPGTYDGIPVHDRLVDYKTSPARSLSATAAARIAPQLALIKACEFGFVLTSGVDRGRPVGHCAILVRGKIHEVHWRSGPDDSFLFDDRMDFKDWEWSSGLLVVPRGQWKVSR